MGAPETSRSDRRTTRARCSSGQRTWAPSCSTAFSRCRRFTPQEGEATYAEKIGPADRELDWSRPPEELHNGFARSRRTSARGAELHGRPVIVWRSRMVDGRLEILEVQPEGRRRMTLEEFERGLR